MFDSILGLAISIQNSKGVYALLLGSGVSRSSGVPTGWEILQDLIRRVARLHKEDPPNLEEWFRKRYGVEPDYSLILGELAPSPAERTKLLQAYFEPNEKEREEGRKVPTPAHRAIAELVAKEYIRVILTTNFDRLLEQALADVGIQPSVISSADAARGAMPLVHARCTVIKVNGDYLDPRFKNTRDELSAYEPDVDRLLDRVFDEYGLIVCGWSADWDTALRVAIERCTNRRFSTYWATRGECSERAERLVSLRGALRLPIAGADEFFQDLADGITALESLADVDPISAKVAVARAKQYLSEARHAIRLHDLVSRETERVMERISNAHFPSGDHNVTTETIVERLRQYDGELDILEQLLASVTYFGKSDIDELILRVFKRVGAESAPESGITVWLTMKRYPAVRLFYAVGLAAIAAGNYRTLRKVAYLPMTGGASGEEYQAITRLQDDAAMERHIQQQILRPREHTPLSNYLYETLRGTLRDYLPSDAEYDDAFNWFEYLSCLCSLDAKLSAAEAQELAESTAPDVFGFGVPVGRFGWNGSRIRQNTAISGDHYPDRIAAVLQAGFFDSGTDGSQAKKYNALKTLVDRVTNEFRRNWRVFW